ncbi:hypothetical protein PHISCL_08484 [Aspergillus sclerotialis]|uniref:Uncharacterized protein n=1 Tax=Aspergillus sclerotialis TaxID=2070753 RepID=A0A3A2ZD09_9EURO|nr:hypothetical protein PHISCL_08484 [Aspergillus sclerotialis]
MAWYSILPPQLIYLESWAAKIFFALGILTIVPWATLLIFDIVLYICRMSLYEFPVVGGRARGMQRPRAPRLNERPRPRMGRFAVLRGDGEDTGVDEGTGPGTDEGSEGRDGRRESESGVRQANGDADKGERELKWRSPNRGRD